MKRGEVHSTGNIEECNTTWLYTTLLSILTLSHPLLHNMFMSLFITLSTFILVVAQRNPSRSSNTAIDSSAITYLDNSPRKNADVTDSCGEIPQQHFSDFAARSESVWYNVDRPDEPLTGQAAVNYEKMVQTIEYSKMVWHIVEDFANERGWREGEEEGTGLKESKEWLEHCSSLVRGRREG
jgi:hypothetical protein